MLKNHVIFFDVDGTLVDPVNHCVPDSVPGALKMLKDAGYALCIASGRSVHNIPEDIINLIDWDGYICNNGQAVHDGKKNVLSCKYMSEDLVKKIIKSSDDTGFAYCLECKSDEEVFLLHEPTKETHESYDFFHLPMPKVITDARIDNIVTLLIYRSKKDGFDDLYAMPEITVTPGITDYADIALAGYNKYTGIVSCLESFGKTKSIVVGDSLNDLEMMEGADVSIAVDGGEQAARDAADFVSTTPADDGILNAVKWILEKNFD